MDNQKYAKEMRSQLEGWAVVLQDLGHQGVEPDLVKALLDALASALSDHADTMGGDGFHRLEEQARSLALRALDPGTWSDAMAGDEDEHDQPPAVRVALSLADSLRKRAAFWAEVYEAKHREDVLRLAREPVAVE
jgi:hypothetical protein